MPPDAEADAAPAEDAAKPKAANSPLERRRSRRATRRAMPDVASPSIVVLGAGFAGLNAVRTFSRAGQRVLWVDGRNYHTFLPLLYQVATAGLEPQGIVYPTRAFLPRL